MSAGKSYVEQARGTAERLKAWADDGALYVPYATRTEANDLANLLTRMADALATRELAGDEARLREISWDVMMSAVPCRCYEDMERCSSCRSLASEIEDALREAVAPYAARIEELEKRK